MSYDLGTAHGKIELEYTGRKAVDSAEADMARLSRESKKTGKSFKELSRDLKSFAGGVGKATLWSGIGLGLGNAAVQAANFGVQILGVVPALTSILSLSAAIPGAVAGGIAAFATLKLATAGVGDTLKAAFDPKKAAEFAKALKELSPSAAAFATEIKKAVPGLKGFQKGIQEAFFSSSGLAKAVPTAVAALQSIRPNLEGMAQDFGGITKEVTSFATSGQNISFVQDAITEFRNALGLVSPALVPILEGLVSVGRVGLPLLTRLGGAVSGLATNFADWLSAVSSDGRLQQWIDTALQTLGTLGDIAKNVGTILTNIFQIAGQTGGGLLNTIAQITGEFARFVTSAEGGAQIRALFTGIGQAAAQLAPVITTLVGALAGALGPALADLAATLGPALLQTVQALAPAFGPLAQAIADAAGAIAPLLPAVAGLIALFAQGLAGEVSAVAEVIGPLASMLGGTLLAAFETLGPVITGFVQQALPLAAQFGQELLAALAPLAPVILQVAQQLATSLVPVLPQLLQAAQTLLPSLVQLASALTQLAVSGLSAIVPLIPIIVQGMVGMATSFATILSIVAKVVTGIINFGLMVDGLIEKARNFAIGFVTSIGGAFSSVFNTVVSVGGQIIAWFVALPGRVFGALATLVTGLPALIGGAIKQAAFEFGAAIGTIVTLAVNLPGRIMGAISSLQESVPALISRAWNAAKSVTSAGINAITSFASTLKGRVIGAINSLPGALSALMNNAWNSAKSAVSAGINGVVSLAKTIRGRIVSAVGDLSSALVGIGRDAVNGLIGGIRSGIGAAADAARSLGRSVLSGISSTLKIGSPSKEMIKIGRFVGQGLEIGLLGSASQIKAASNKLANYVTDAFSDKLIKRSQRNTVLGVLKTGTRQLTSLVNQSTVVAARLKDAQKHLADVQKSYNDVFASAVAKTKQSFSLVTSGQQFINLDATKRKFQDAVAQAKEFANNINTLTKRGLNQDLLQQLADAGAADGGAMAKALAGASDATLKEFNSLQTQLTSAANSVGKATAEAMFGAGLRAAEGLVAGLQKQQASIQKQMDKIADSMVARIKKALKIKSPSRVMFNLGKFTSQGLLNGLASLRKQVAQAAEKLATASIIPTVRLNAATPNDSTTRSSQSPPPGGITQVINQTVNALPGMDARQVAGYSATRLSLALKTGVSAIALPVPTPQGA